MHRTHSLGVCSAIPLRFAVPVGLEHEKIAELCTLKCICHWATSVLLGRTLGPSAHLQAPFIPPQILTCPRWKIPPHAPHPLQCIGHLDTICYVETPAPPSVV